MATQDADEKKRKELTIYILVGLGVVVVIGGAVGLVLYFKKKRDDKERQDKEDKRKEAERQRAVEEALKPKDDRPTMRGDGVAL